VTVPVGSRRPPAAGPHNALIDVHGIRVGHHTAVGDGFLTGTTVVLAPDGGMTAGVDVRGAAPGTHETDLLHPTASVQSIHALVLSGGAAYGLAACTGVMDGLAERGIGLPVGPGAGEVVPLVPGAVIFDLGRGGDFRARPTADFGRIALAAALGDGSDGSQAARSDATAVGSLGAGTGAVTSNLKGGLGQASVVLPGGVVVAALAVTNAAGSPIDPTNGELLGARLLIPADGRPPGSPAAGPLEELLAITSRRPERPLFSAEQAQQAQAIGNTTLAVVATDAGLTKTQCNKLAAVAQNGIARALNPVNTMVDGDAVFAVATGGSDPPDLLAFHEILTAAANVVTRAIVRALLGVAGTSTPAGQWSSWRDVAEG